MTSEAKVGAFTIAALALLAFIAIHLTGFQLDGDKGYAIDVMFDQAQGLRAGSGVRYAGVDVGTVQAVNADGRGARISLKINEGTKIPQHSVFSISSDGLMGEKFISISPGKENDGTFIEPGVLVFGSAGHDVGQMMAKATQTLEETQKLVQSLNDILGNPAVKTSLVQSALNLKDLTGNLNELTLLLQRMAVNNEQDLRSLVQNLNVMSGSLVSAADGVDQLIHDFSGNGQTAANLRLAVTNLTSTSQRIEHMAANLEPVVADPQTAADLRVILQNTKNVTARADSMLEKVSSIQTEAGVDVLYSGSKQDWQTNADFRIYASPQKFLLLGVDDIGDGNKTNVQLGTVQGDFIGRAGIVDNKVGLGLDLQPAETWKVSFDAYDPDDVRLKLRAQYRIAPDTYLIGQTNNINKKDERAAYFGVRRTF